MTPAVAPGPREDAGRGPGPDLEDDPAGRWSWVWWALLLAAALPLAVSVVAVQRLAGDAGAVVERTGYEDAPVVLADRWALVLVTHPPGWPAAISAFALLALAAVVAAGAPGWLLVACRRLLVGVTAAGCAVWAAGTAALSAWSVLRAPTARETATAQQGSVRPSVLDHGVETGLGVLAAAVATLAVVLCVTTREPSPRPPQDPR